MTTTLLTKHVVLADGIPSSKQLTGKETAYLINDTKQKLFSSKTQTESKSIKELLQAFSEGQNIILADVNLKVDPSFYTKTDHKEKMRSLSIEFVSSDIFAIDIDDDDSLMDPLEVLNKQNGKAIGLFYTFSHGKKGNRYRLMYQLDKKVTDANEFKAIVQLVQEDLIEQGIPGVDKQASNPVSFVRGGKKGYVIHDRPKRLDTDAYLKTVRENLEKRRKSFEERFEDNDDKVFPPFKALKEGAEAIGYIPSREGMAEMWTNILYALGFEVQRGNLTDEEGYDLYRIISGAEESYYTWEYYRNNADGRRTIGSFIEYAQKAGYDFHFSYSNSEQLEQTYKIETIPIKEFVSKSDAKELIQRNERLLVDSPTGSGKTTAFLEACKELAAEDVSESQVFILSAPTQALVDQQAKKHNILAIKGETRDVQSENGSLHKYIEKGNRVIATTYDMTSIIVNSLREKFNQFQFTIIVDEVHKKVTDYNFRYIAIKSLEIISRRREVISYIGLSGTTEEVFKNDFDRVIEFKKNDEQSPAEHFSVYTYEKRKDELAYLIRLIEFYIRMNRRLLVFIESRRAIKTIGSVLKKRNIKSIELTSEKKDTAAYQQLINEETIADDIDVILSTTVISDGVNIQNTGSNWSTLTVSTTSSSLFNINVIRQMSNRFRNKYHSHIIYMQEPKHESDGPKDLFNLEGAFFHRLKEAESLVAEFNSLKDVTPDSFWRGVIEKGRGVFQQDDELIIDNTFLRHKSSLARESYYRKYRKSFIKAVADILGQEVPIPFNFSKAIEEGRLKEIESAIDIKQVLEDIAEEKKLTDQEKAKNLTSEYTRDVHEAYETNNTKEIRKFESRVLPMHAAFIKRTHRLYDYEICHRVVQEVTRTSERYKLYNDTKALLDYAYNERYGLRTKTWKVLLDLLDIHEFISNADYEDELKRIAKKRRSSLKEVKDTEKMVEVIRHRSNGIRYKKVQQLSGDSLANRYEISRWDVIDAMRSLAMDVHIRRDRKKLLKAIDDQEIIIRELERENLQKQ